MTRPSAAPSVEPQSILASHVRSIRAQLLGGALIILLMTLWVAFLMASVQMRVFDAMRRVNEDTARVTTALKAGQHATAMFTAIAQGIILRDAETMEKQMEAIREELHEDEKELAEMVAPLPIQEPLWGEISRLRAAIPQLDSWILWIVERGKAHAWEDIEAAYTHLIPYYSAELLESIEQIEYLTAERRAAAMADEEEARQMMRNVSISWGTVLALVILGISGLTWRSIADPLERLAEASARLAAGHWEARVPIERADEFGRLAQAFNNMADHLQTLYNELEERVQERTRALQEANYALQRRAIQLETSAEVSRSIISIFSVDELLRRAVNLIRDRFGFYHAGIFLMDETGEWAVLQEATGEAGAQMKAQGHRLRVGETSMVGWTALHRRPRIALDVGEDAVHFANPLLPYTRSEMTLPLMVGDRLLGVLDVQSIEEAAFDEDDIRTLQSMADQLAIAIENARRVSDEARLLEATSPIFRASRLLATATTLEEIGNAVVTSIAETGADGCIVVLFEPAGGPPQFIHFITTWRRDGAPPIPPGARLTMSDAHLRVETTYEPWSISDLTGPSHLTDEEITFFRRMGVHSVANIPLRAGQQPLGFIVAYLRRPEPFHAAALRLYEALTDMASVAVERVRLTEALQQQVQREEAMRMIADQITATFDLRTALQTTLQQLGQALDARGGYAELGTR
ncbi:MAG: GAF domain-containing protein [Anaerolineae bacterium]